jgi:hypothetical protein
MFTTAVNSQPARIQCISDASIPGPVSVTFQVHAFDASGTAQKLPDLPLGTDMTASMTVAGDVITSGDMSASCEHHAQCGSPGMFEKSCNMWAQSPSADAVSHLKVTTTSMHNTRR